MGLAFDVGVNIGAAFLGNGMGFFTTGGGNLIGNSPLPCTVCGGGILGWANLPAGVATISIPGGGAGDV